MSQRPVNSGMLFTSKPRPTTQPSWQRRRFTKSAATVDGEYDPDLALAIQESLKQAEIDALKAKERQNDMLSKAESELARQNRKDVKNVANSLDLSNETKHLKELVCAHMDLIQQQQDVINQKDKAIKSLRSENSALQCRLQRMERRMALLKQKEDMASHSGGQQHIVSLPPPKPGTMSYTEPLSLPAERLSHKRKLEPVPLPRRSQDGLKSFVHKPSSDSTSGRSKSRDQHRKRKISSVLSSEDESSMDSCSSFSVTYYEPPANEMGEDSIEELISSSKKQKEIEVPTFRIKSYTNLYVIEGTEDHEDETFMRRHQRPELEEKRRKRWDKQRQREEEMLEKHREKEEAKTKNKKTDDPDSFHPCLEDITHIEVTNKLPISLLDKSTPSVKEKSVPQTWAPRTTRQSLRQK